MNYKTDYLGKHINIGDTIIFTTNRYIALYTGIVKRFTKKKVVILIDSVSERMRYPEDILIINK